jgi:hypothetical protein
MNYNSGQGWHQQGMMHQGQQPMQMQHMMMQPMVMVPVGYQGFAPGYVRSMGMGPAGPMGSAVGNSQGWYQGK